ncbi:unnamed protein product [Linum trigynum]|uniref:RRM domain-containing protein n=1 Tax=Linum trigynum TaxID=586398 RepID=A0AAV2GQJ1_9ROSI
MSDGYWNQQQQPSLLPAGGMLKRPRTEYDMQNSGVPAGYDMNSYYGNARDGGTGYQPVKDTKTIVSAYERYLQNQGLPTASREANAFGGGVGMASLPTVDSAVMDRSRATVPDMTTNGYGGPPSGGASSLPRPGRDTVPLPPDASNTLYVEGLPPDCTRREVAHIFRPFVGYKDLRLVSKESKHRGGDPIILCFVDFMDPACAATAMSALQGYKMDEHDLESNYLRLQFSRYPGPRSGLPGRGKR